jgi:hypothetical protein
LAIDKVLYRQSYEWYRQRNDAELVELYRQRGKLTSQEAFRQYAELWSFAHRASHQYSPALDRLRMAELEDYISKVQKLEEWRRSHGK